jgi:hypothetical protein
MRKGIIALCLSVLMVWGCAHPQLTRRYNAKSFAPLPQSAENCVEVSAFTMDSPSEKRKNLVESLSGEGQAALINEVGKRSKSLGDLTNTLTGSGTKEGFIDKTVFNKRLVFAVTKKFPGEKKGDLTLADRINLLRITLDFQEPKPPSQNYKEEDHYQKGFFDSWSIFEAKQKTVDLGKISRTQSVTAEISSSIGPAAQNRIPASLTASLTGEKKIEEEVNLKQQYIELAGKIWPDKRKAELYQEGAVGIDLTGTSLVDLVIRADNISGREERVVVLGPLEKDGKPLKPQDVQVDFIYINYVKETRKVPNPNKLGKDKRVLDPIKCWLTYDYMLRHVVAKDRETAEGYHKVNFWQGSGPGELIELVSPSELKATVFCLYEGVNPLNIEGIGTLQFSDFTSAQDCLRWMKENKFTNIGKYKIFSIPNKYLRKSDIPLLNIRPYGLNYDP